MIIRILGEGQYEVPDNEMDRLNALDARLESTVDAGDTVAFGVALDGLLDCVRRLGTPLPDRVLAVSDLVLPAPGSDLHEIAALLGDEGLIPG